MSEILVGDERVSIGNLIGKGGEGEVYAIKSRSGQAVKIYDPSLRDKREDKVLAMVGEHLAAKTNLVAYPSEVATDLSGNFLGFIMRLVSGCRPLHELYSPKSRLRHFQKSDYRFVVRAALNVARAVGSVHKSGCVIGDLNHSGVLIAGDATVALIDADSFQFSLNNRLFPCVVGVPEFTPPELHGKNLSEVQRELAHDNFGLAVAIFHLLFMGRHPYAGRHKAPDISMAEAIARNHFAYTLTRQASTQTIPPNGTLTLDMFPSAVSREFENAFGISPNARPGALDWIHALQTLEASLNHCSAVKTHYYPNKAGRCVWCMLASSSGFDMFPDLGSVNKSIPNNSINTEQAIREIMAFRFPDVNEFLPKASVKSGASASLRQARKTKSGNTFKGSTVIGIAIAGFIYIPELWFIFFAVAFWGWTIVADKDAETASFLKAYSTADDKVLHLFDDFLMRHGLTEIVQVHNSLSTTIAAYQKHDNLLVQKISALKANRKSRHLQAFLDRFSIRQADIPGIGPARIATLISFGIETASDISNSSVMQVPGFGKLYTKKLVDWRREKEYRFNYDPTPNSQDIKDDASLRSRYAAEKMDLESKIFSGLSTLRTGNTRLKALSDRAKKDRLLINALSDRAIAEQDLREMGVSVPVSALDNYQYFKPRPIPRGQKSTFTTHINTPTLQSTAKTPLPNRPIPASTPTAPASPNCPICTSKMKRRSGRYGNFWGCSKYPGCKGTRNI